MKIGFDFPNLDFVEELVFYNDVTEDELSGEEYGTFYGEVKLEIVDIRLERTCDRKGKLIIELGIKNND